MFYSDKPIEKSSKDRLNRTIFSKQLAQAVLSYTQQDNFTISLCGKWGSGKTSILNMIVEEIEQKTKYCAIDTKPIIIFFNPWNYSDRTQLISQFFQTIQSEIALEKTNEALKAVGLALQKYSAVFDYTSYIPIVGKYLEPIKSIISGVGEQISGVAEENESLVRQKEKVIEALSSQKQKIIIIIDDIDRLNNEQIRLIFQLVNSLAGFPNMIYLLSFDKSVVVRALEEEQKCNGEEYLEKIVQVPFEVPNTKISSVQNVFFDMLNEIVLKEISCDEFDKDYWSSIFSNCISPFIKTIRDVNRVINVFRFKYGLMHNETNWIDLLALTTFQVCASNIFDWTYNNIVHLTGSHYNNGITGINQNKNKENAIAQFKSIHTENPEVMLKAVQTLFPKYSRETGGYTHHIDTEEELRRKQKVACADRAPFYFSLSLEDIVISKEQILLSIKEYSLEELDSYFNRLVEEESVSEYLDELITYVSDIPLNKLRLFIDKLINLQTLHELNEKNGMFEIVPAYKCNKCCWALLKRLNKEQIENELISIVNSVDADSLSIIIGMIISIECSYARIGNSMDYDYRIVDENQLPNIEILVLKKIKEFSISRNLFDIFSFSNIYRFWNYIDKQSIDDYIMKMLEEPKNIPKYLNICASHWVGGGENGWNFKENNFSEHISADDAYTKILSMKNTSNFSSLKKEIKEIAVAYCLWYNSDRKNYHEISKDSVDLLISEWECK